ncbi:MAG: hypothetical protein WDN03_05665 [Rhizomicrobium sp.]
MSEIFDALFTKRGKFFYQAWFQKLGAPEAEAEADPRGFLRKFYYALSGDAPKGAWPSDKTADRTLLDGLIDPPEFPAWLTPKDLDYYVGEFERSGFFGPISRYRNHERDFDYLRGFADRRVEQPASSSAAPATSPTTCSAAATIPLRSCAASSPTCASPTSSKVAATGPSRSAPKR